MFQLMHLYNVEQGLLSVNLSKGALYLTVGAGDSLVQSYFLDLLHQDISQFYALFSGPRAYLVGVSQGLTSHKLLSISAYLIGKLENNHYI